MNTSKITTYYLDGQGGASTDLPAHEDDKGLIWHHLRYTDVVARNWIKGRDELSERAKLTLLDNETRPRAEIEEQQVILCLRGINFNDENNPEDMISIRVWMNQTTVISTSNQISQSVRRVRADLEKRVGPKCAEQLLLSLVEKLAELTDDFVDKMDLKIDDVEDALEDLSLTEFTPQMNQMRRQIANIKRYLLPQKEAIDKLYRTKTKFFSESFYDQIYIYVDKFMQLIERLDLMRERALMLQEHFIANISHQQNSRLYLLAIISAIFLPLTFLSGLFGMNVAGLPGVEEPQAFNYVIVFSVVLTVILLIWFKKSKWF